MKDKLTAHQKDILDNKATEPAFTGKLLNNKKDGTYNCVRCGSVLFSSEQKFDSGSGWPSFYQAAATGAVQLLPDDSHGMHRTEVICAKCGGHLGHVFDDAPQTPTGQRYCINSCILNFKERIKDGN